MFPQIRNQPDPKSLECPSQPSGSSWLYWWLSSPAARIITSTRSKPGRRRGCQADHHSDRHRPHRQHHPARQRHRHPGAATESNLGFQTSGTLTVLNVQVGSQVKAGDLIAQLDSSNQQLALSQAQQALNELTSPAAIATAQQAVVTAKTNLINDQYILNTNQTAGSNQDANNNAYAALALAQNKLNTAQLKYDPVSGGYSPTRLQPSSIRTCMPPSKPTTPPWPTTIPFRRHPTH